MQLQQQKIELEAKVKEQIQASQHEVEGYEDGMNMAQAEEMQTQMPLKIPETTQNQQ